ncbi:hypothetical protein G6F65_021719 [Rhizopus arrhizus]|nr:hypothetical protein G6F65_021719 [Rhizopus arrhizus]
MSAASLSPARPAPARQGGREMSDLGFALTVIVAVYALNTLIIGVPLGYSFWLSLHDTNAILRTEEFVGADLYGELGLCGHVRGGIIRRGAGHRAGAERRDAAARPGARAGALALGDVPGGDRHGVLVPAEPQLRRPDRVAGAAGPGQRGHGLAGQRLGAVLGRAGGRLAFRAAG